MSNISLISIHTNFDSFIQGTNKILSDKLGLKIINFLVPDKSIPECGMGVITIAEKPLTAEELLERVHDVCSAPVKFSEIKQEKILKKIAIVGGSGSSFIDAAISAGCDVLITADLSYHQYHRVNGKLMLVDPGHYEMEQFVPFGLSELLRQNLDKKNYDSINVSRTLTNPVRHYPFTKKYYEKQKNLINN